MSHIKRRFARLPPWVAVVLASVLLVGVLLPITDSGMRGDDSHVAVGFEGARELDGRSLATLVGDEIQAAFDVGRPHPLGVAGGTVITQVAPERFPYKLAIALASLASLLALLAFLRAFNPPRGTLLVAVVAVTLSLQFRHTHDPALGYYATQQVSILLLFGGLAAYLRFLRGGGTRWYVATLVLALMFLFNYEANHPLVLAFACLHLGRDPLRVRSWRFALPILGMGAAMTMLSFYLRLDAPVAEAYETSTEPFAVILTAARQALSSIPNIYFLSGANGLLPDPTRAEILAAGWRAALAAAILVLAFMFARREPRGTAGLFVTSSSSAEREPSPRREPDVPTAAAATVAPPAGTQTRTGSGTTPSATWGALPIAAIGAALMSLSGLYISLANQHQDGIGLGGGHLATFAGTVGFTMLAAAAWIRWSRLWTTSVSFIGGATVAVFVMAFATQYTNLRVVAIERPGIEQRELLKRGLDRGVLGGVGDGTTVYITNRDLNWSFGNLIFYGGTADLLVLLRTGRQLDVRPFTPLAEYCGQPTGFPAPDCAFPSRNVAWLAVRAAPGGGSVILASGIPRERVGEVPPRRITVVSRDGPADDTVPSLVGGRADGTPWSAEEARWRRHNVGGGWARYTTKLGQDDGPLAASLTDPRSPVDFDAPRPAGDFVRLFGTAHLLP